MAHIGNSPASYFTAVSSDVFSANGTATAFTLSKYVSNLADLEIVVNNIQQNPYSGSYSVSNNTLTFSEAPLAGSNNVVVTYRQATIGSTIPTPNTVGNNALQRDLLLTGNTVISGVLTASANVNFDAGTLFVDGTNNRIGINNTAPTQALTVTGTSALGNTVITGTLSASANVNLDSGTLFVDGTNNRVGINNTAPTQALTVTGTTSLTGNLTVAGYSTFTGNVDITSSDSNPVNIISTSNIAFLRVRSTNTTSTYSYLQFTATDAGQGHGYLIKNGNNGGNGLANGSLYLWNAEGSNTAIEFVPGGTIGNRSTVYANGSFIVRGHLGVGNTTPYNSNWGSNTDQISVGGGRNYGLITLNGPAGSNSSFSSGVGDGKYYMAYDNINAKHHIQVSATNGIQFPYQLHIHGTPGVGTRGATGVANTFTPSYNRSTLSFSNSRVTVPLAGVYLIVFQTICSDGGSGRFDSDIRVNGTQVVTGLNNASDSSTSDYKMRTHTCSVQLSASDYIQFYHSNWYTTGGSYDTWGTISVTLLG